MKFSEIMRDVETLSISGDAEILGVAFDSRRVRPGFLFVAMRGESSDGNRFIEAAVQAGASAVVSDAGDPPPATVAFAKVAHGRRALARISENFYGRPAQKLKLTGITGTNERPPQPSFSNTFCVAPAVR